MYGGTAVYSGTAVYGTNEGKQLRLPGGAGAGSLAAGLRSALHANMRGHDANVRGASSAAARRACKCQVSAHAGRNPRRPAEAALPCRVGNVYLDTMEQKEAAPPPPTHTHTHARVQPDAATCSLCAAQGQQPIYDVHT